MQTAPSVRIDREPIEAVEREIRSAAVYEICDLVNALTKTGAIYGQLVLPPHEAAAKRQAMGANNVNS